MAESSEKPKRRVKKSQTVRQKAESIASAPPKKKSGRFSRVTKPVKRVHAAGKREFYLPLPDNKLGRFFNKRRHYTPSYLRNSFKELRDVRWPNRKQTTQLTIAVFFFAFIFGVIITITDYGLDKLFKKVLLK